LSILPFTAIIGCRTICPFQEGINVANKLVFVLTHGPEDPEKATIPFVMAVAAQASDVEATLVFQSNSVLLLRKGMAEHVPNAGFAPLPDLIHVYRENGGRLLACVPCLKARQLAADDLIEGTEMIAAGVAVAEFLSATSVISY
jgi:predicted peroxiredoxin